TELNWSVGWQNQDWNLFGGAQGFDLVVVQVRKVTHRTSVDWVRVLHVFWVYRSSFRCLVTVFIAAFVYRTGWRNLSTQVGVTELPVPLESSHVKDRKSTLLNS